MPDTALLGLVAARLADQPPQQDAADVVIAAFQGPAAVADRLEHPGGAAIVVPKAQAAQARNAVYLAAIEVEGFRGVGQTATLDLTPGPGLTLIVGRNGSGKSSFAEALEMLLTGSNRRWFKRPRVWLDGWQNLHHKHTRIAARFAVEGRRQQLEVRRDWADGADLEASTLSIDGKRVPTLDSLGWTGPLADYPPLLSHNELEHSLDDTQAKLYDALTGILGLGELNDAKETLRQARLSLENEAREAQRGATILLQLLEHTDDERAATAITALQKKQWDIAAIERLVAVPGGGDERGTLNRLHDIAGLHVVDREDLLRAASDVRATHEALARQHGTDAARAHELAALLQQAIAVHSHSDTQECPVCGARDVLTYEWRLRAGERVSQLRSEAQAVEQAQRNAVDAVRAARRLITALPVALRDAGDIGIDISPVLAAWQQWADAPANDEPLPLAQHLESRGPALLSAVGSARAAAKAEIERRDKSWRPTSQAIAEWLPLGRRARAGEAALKRLKAAETWLRDAHDAIRDERFQPIADAVQAHWNALRQESNVTLAELGLAGTGNLRRLRLDVKVDGEPGSALGVMSQGELNCLALSLFLPRASLEESPFQFVVIDDPVQAMDPAKVEGLARVFGDAAKQRQVIVLTHDDRLADAVRFLQVEATVIEVVRREQSVVELQRRSDPVQRYIEDAFAVAKSDGLPQEAERVIPGYCRMAIEAACALAVTRRMLRQGRRYADVHSVLDRDFKLYQWLALALFDDPDRSGDVIAHLQQQRPASVEAVKECNRGAHSGRVAPDLMGFIRSVEKLTGAIVAREIGV